MNRLLPCGLLCLGLITAATATEYRRPFRLTHEDPLVIVPVKKASAVRPPPITAYDRGDLFADPAAVRDAQAARLVAIASVRRRRPPNRRRSCRRRWACWADA